MSDNSQRAGDSSDSEISRTDFLAAIRRGENVACPTCGSPVEYRGKVQGIHPGLYCANGHTVALIETAMPGITDKT